MITIYYNLHQNHKRELNFFNRFIEHLPDSKIVENNYEVDDSYLDKYVDTLKLITCLQVDTLLPKTRRKRCIDILKDCPTKIKIALKSSRVTFDIVVEENEKIFYWEFHEEQHKKMSNSQTKKVFSPEGLPVNVPRYLQRLVRDVWRVIYFRPYTIVWSDFFYTNMTQFNPSLRSGFHEFYNSDKFSFYKFCQGVE